jgi:hypothetical protein
VFTDVGRRRDAADIKRRGNSTQTRISCGFVRLRYTEIYRNTYFLAFRADPFSLITGQIIGRL